MSTLSLQDYINQVQSLIHDSTFSAWSSAEIIRRINDARKNVSIDMHCVRSLITVQLLTGKEIYNYNGAVGGATVTAGGSNYGTGATIPVTFGAAPPGGITATGFGNLTSGSLTSITMTQWGAGYTSVPTVTVGGAGTGAAANAVALLNVLNVISISVIWNLMRYSLSFRGFSVFYAWVRTMKEK